MPTTSNFGWTTPADTDLVKDGAAAIRTLGNNIDASLVDLKGGTTGQVLAKATNTDLDFTWVAQDDSNAIQNAIVDAKGDLITATAADVPARLGVGANGTVLTANSATATGLEWATVSAGGMTLLSTTTLTGQTTSITNISQDYTDLIILVYGVLVSSNNNWIACNFRNGSTLLPLYNAGRITGFDTSNQNPATHWLGAAAGQSNTISRNNFLIYVKNYTATGQMEKHIEERSFFYNATSQGYDFTLFTGLLDTTSPLNELLFDAAGTTTFSAGTVKIYGVK